MTSSAIMLSIVQVALDTLSEPNFLSSFKASVRIETTGFPLDLNVSQELLMIIYYYSTL